MKIVDTRVNHLINPVGFRMDSIKFSWKVVESNDFNPFEGLYSIQIHQGENLCFETGFKKLNPIGCEVDFKPEPQKKYNWNILVQTEGETVCFEGGSFETGKMGEKFKADWICAEYVKGQPVFSKSFLCNKKIKSARLYITGLGLYEAYINGKKAGDEFLAPGLTTYSKCTQLQTYDVTDLLAENNEIRVFVGDGWYRGKYGFHWNKEEAERKPLMILAELHIAYEDGESDLISTDGTWMVEESQIRRSGIYFGEEIDGTFKADKSMPVKIVNHPDVVLMDRLSLPVKRQESFEAKIIDTANKELVLDIGQNMSGLFEITVDEPKGTVVKIEAGECLQDGCFYRDNLRSAQACFIYKSSGKKVTVRPHFTFYGFRYLRLSGFSNFKPEDIKVFAIYSDFEKNGILKTGNEDINKLISNTGWGMKSNFLDVPTDCPQRDERMGWTGDAQVFSKTAFFYGDVYPFYDKYLNDMEIEQDLHKGGVTDTVPAFGQDGCCSVWGDATTIIPWNMYQFTGDTSILKRHYPYMKKWLEYIAEVDGTDHNWRRVFHYGDWLALDSPYDNVDAVKGGTDEGFIADVYYRKSNLIAASTARILGFETEARELEARADKILRDIQDEFYSKTGRCCINTQTGQVLTLCEDLGDKERAKASLKELLDYRLGKLSTGFVGTSLLCETLTTAGMPDYAYRLLMNRYYPGWIYSIRNGATTVWERWNSIDETGHISSTGMNSLNHYSYGSVVSFIWERSAGLKPLEPGFRKVRIEPFPNKKIGNLEALYNSPCGIFKIAWKITGNQNVGYNFEIPMGCEAEVVLADGKHITLSGGTFSFSAVSKEPFSKIFTVDDKLKDIVKNQDAEDVLRENLKDFNDYMTWGADYPLSETMNNKGVGGKEAFERLNKLLRKACE